MSRMKAVIMEIKGKYAAVLSDDGRVRRLKNRQYAVGQQIDIQALQSFAVKYALRAACAAAVIMATGISAYAYCTPYSYVSLDVNPSFEYSLNRFDRVLDCKAVDVDGEEILANLQLKNKSIEEAIEVTVGQIKSFGYFAGSDAGGIVIAASSPDEKKSVKLADNLEITAKETVKESELKIEVEAQSVSGEIVEEARALGVTPGKLMLVEKLAQSETGQMEINREEWLDKPVKEILKQIKENKQEAKNKAEEPAKETKENGKPKKESDEKPSNSAASNQNDQLNNNGQKKEDASDSITDARPENQRKDNNENGRKSDRSVVKDKAEKGTSDSKVRTKKWFWPFR